MTQTSKVGNHATTISWNEGYQCVTYHSTVVVKWNNEKIILNSDGWDTVTTKSRMNQTAVQFHLGYRVWQKDFAWYVDYKGQTFDYYDNMELTR